MTGPSFPLPEAQPPRRSRWGVVFALLGVVAVGSGVAWWLRGAAPTEAQATAAADSLQGPSPDDSLARAPQDARVTVRVLNASGVRGLARRATLHLREFGYDVVDFDSDRKARGDSTQVLAHRGHRDWAERLRRALGTGAVSESADSSRYVDVTVVLGRDWKPPTQPLRP